MKTLRKSCLVCGMAGSVPFLIGSAAHADAYAFTGDGIVTVQGVEIACTELPFHIAAQLSECAPQNGQATAIELQLDTQFLEPARPEPAAIETDAAPEAPPLEVASLPPTPAPEAPVPQRRPDPPPDFTARAPSAPAPEVPSLAAPRAVAPPPPPAAEVPLERTEITRPPALTRTEQPMTGADIQAALGPIEDDATARQLAALTSEALGPGESVAALSGGRGFRLLFRPDSHDLTNAAGVLLTGLGQRMIEDERLRIQVRAYAGGGPDRASVARRMSLERALNVRSFLTDRGVSNSRIDIRALGNSAVEGPEDRVDLVFMD